MALRHGRGAGLRRAAHGRAGVVALAIALYTAAGLLALAPEVRHAGSHFLAYGHPRANSVTPGDYLQSIYNLWLPGHQLEHRHAPWKDPYSFQPEAAPRTNYPAWPFAIVFWPLHALLGTVKAWNLFLVLTYVGAGAFGALWLRSLGLGRGAALVGGLAFALAPYRSAQTAGGHLLAPVSMLIPLALYAVEEKRNWLAVGALASIPLSGQVHLTLGVLPFFVAYALVRGRIATALAGALSAAVVGLVVYLDEIRGSVGAGGRSFAQVEKYSADAADLFTRDARHGFETYVFLGWLVPAAALVGLVLLWRRERGLAAVLGLGATIPIVLALGSHTPIYHPLWRVVPGLHHTRVPERFLPIASLCVAALAAFAVQRVRWRWFAAAAVVLVALDLRVNVYDAMLADEHNNVYASLRSRPPGRLLEDPVVRPDRQEGSVYLYYAMQAPRERALGYSTTAPPSADRVARRLRADRAAARSLGVRYVVVYRDGTPLTLRTASS